MEIELTDAQVSMIIGSLNRTDSVVIAKLQRTDIGSAYRESLGKELRASRELTDTLLAAATFTLAQHPNGEPNRFLVRLK
jgi:hypothetical protein